MCVCVCVCSLIFFLNVCLFLRGRQSVSGGEAERERETQNPKQAPGSEWSAQSPTWGSNSRTARLWPEPKSVAQLTEPARHSIHLILLHIFLSQLSCLNTCVENHLTISVRAYFWTLNSVVFISISIIPIPHCFDYCNFVVSLEIWKHLVFLFFFLFF